MTPEEQSMPGQTPSQRPSIFDRFDEKYPDLSQRNITKAPTRSRPLVSRRAADRQKLGAAVFCCLVMGLAVGGWQWSLNLSQARTAALQQARIESGAQSSGVQLTESQVTLEAGSHLQSSVNEVSVLDDSPSVPADSKALSLRSPLSPKVPGDSPKVPGDSPKVLPLKVPDSPKVPGDSQVLGDSPKVLGDSPKVPGDSPKGDSPKGYSLSPKVSPKVPGDSPEVPGDSPKVPPEVAIEPTVEPAIAELDDFETTVFKPAVKIQGVQPSYPATAHEAGRQGTVLLEAQIDARGKVSSIATLESASAEFEAASRQALSAWIFEPARRDGEPVMDFYRVRFRFAAPETSPAIASRRPVKVNSPLPSYPPSAWAANTHGEVKLRVLIDERGEVGNIEVVQGLPNGVNEAVISAVERWKFKPALQNGQPVAAYEQLTFRF